MYKDTPDLASSAICCLFVPTLDSCVHYNVTNVSRKPVVDVTRPVEVLSSGGLRGSVVFSLRISGKSSITQEVILDASCPYIKFKTQVKTQ